MFCVLRTPEPRPELRRHGSNDRNPYPGPDRSNLYKYEDLLKVSWVERRAVVGLTARHEARANVGMGVSSAASYDHHRIGLVYPLNAVKTRLLSVTHQSLGIAIGFNMFIAYMFESTLVMGQIETSVNLYSSGVRSKPPCTAASGRGRLRAAARRPGTLPNATTATPPTG
jgi:hypothetical protein